MGSRVGVLWSAMCWLSWGVAVLDSGDALTHLATCGAAVASVKSAPLHAR
jgi:hypothetical protein